MDFPFSISSLHPLKRKLGPQQNLTRIDDRCQRLQTERAQVAHVRVGIREVVVIENVDEITTNLQVHFMGQRKPLHQTQVGIRQPGTAERISAEVPTELHRVPEIRDCPGGGVRHVWGIDDSCSIQGNAEGPQVAGIGIRNEDPVWIVVRPAGRRSIAEAVTYDIGSDTDRERLSRLHFGETADLPSGQRMAEESIRRRRESGNPVCILDRKPMRTVEHRS